MIKRHEIGELDRSGIVLSLSPGERRALALVEDRLGVEWRPDGSARIYSGGCVGTVTLSPHLVVDVTTKVPVANVLALASLAYRTLPIPPALGAALLESAQPVVDWLAVLLVNEVQALLAHGVRQDYVLIDDELPYVRGRLRFNGATLPIRPGLTPCQFADYLPDIPENRLLRTTLDVLPTQRLLPGLRLKVADLLRSFQGVTLVRPTADLVDACRITRLNQHYRPALELCRLLVEHSGVELGPGEVVAPAYFFPMADVFQEAVTSILRDRLPNVSRQSGGTCRSVTGEPKRSLSFAADIIVGSPSQLVIDTKYTPPETRNQYGGWSFHNDHVYQVVFYALKFGCPALLVYPRVDRDINVTFDIADIPVSIVTVDLEQAGLIGLEMFVETVAGLTHGSAAA